MVVNLSEIRKAALALPRKSRAKLVDELLQSLNKPSNAEQAEIRAAWIAEAEDRYRAYKKGLIKAIPADEVMREIRSRKKP